MNTLLASATCMALIVSTVQLRAAPQQECLSLWKTADIDANGALSAAEDKANYIAAAVRSGRSMQQPDEISRDEFLQLCAEDAFAASGAPAASPGPAASKDLGKGDLTPAAQPLSELDARKKLEASGVREIQDLKVGEDGIWRGTAIANGQRQDVAIDAQGDIIGKPEMTQGSARPMTSAPATENMQAAGAASVEAARGSAGRGGLLLWTFLLGGNALALVMLSLMTSGGKSAMSSRTDASAFA
jgi:hypothetical protein